MTTTAPKKPRPPVGTMYAVLYPFFALRAREKGYALALHGTVSTDLDLVAVPWTAEASSAEELVAYFLEWGKDDLFLIEQDIHNGVKGHKPHGRRVWSLHLRAWCGAYIDLSIMPREESRP